MIDLQASLSDLPIGVLALVAALAGLVIAFFLIRKRTDTQVKELADLAYACAAKIAGVKPKGSPPPVTLRNKPWTHNGVTVYGLYTWKSLFGRVLWDRIQVVEDRTYIYPVLVHEMIHAVRRRMGKPTSEEAAYTAQAVANEMCGGPEVNALLEKI